MLVLGESRSIMESIIDLFHAMEVCTMDFRGTVKPKRWNRILNLVDDMTRVVVRRVLHDIFFNYESPTK